MDVTTLLAERNTTHGDFDTHAFITQRLKTALHNSPNWRNLKEYQKEALDMIAHKIGRILNGRPDYIDHWADMVGYSQLVVNILNNKNKI